MTEVEAGEFIQRLVHAYPGSKFTEQNARAYQSMVVTLEASEAEAARLELVETSKFIPSFAEIREIVMRNRRNARNLSVARPVQLPAGSGYPSAQEWGRKVGGMLSEAERYERMARAWYAAKGKPCPGDPAAPILETVKAGARGEDIGEGLQRVVEGEAEELERRYP